MTRFEWIEPEPAATVRITVDGTPVTVAAGRSLLAALLATGSTSVSFFCAIGQCQRCVVRVNGVARLACLVHPADGDMVETRVLEQRSPRWEVDFSHNA